MSSHFFLGAINKKTEKYEYPNVASKENKYKCPDCFKDVIFKRGDVRIHHFAHYQDENPCTYYSKPTESQIHKDAKLLLKSLLDKDIEITFTRICNRCNWIDEYVIDKESCNAVIEYRFKYNNSDKSADVALINNNCLKYIFEIWYKHRTSSDDRPEPWFEINAENLINKYKENNDIIKINIDCARYKLCQACIHSEINEKERLKKIQEEIVRKQEEIVRKQEEIVRKQEEEKIKREKEKEHQRRIAENREKYFKRKSELSVECMTNARNLVKKCSKCKITGRCSKCVTKISKIYNDDLNSILSNEGIFYSLDPSE